MTCTLLVSVGWFRIQCTVVFPSSCYYIYTNMQPTPHTYEYYVCAQYILLKYHVHACCIQYSHMYCTHTHTHIYHTPANHTHSNIIYTCHAHPKHIQTIMCTLHIHTRTYTLKHTQTHYLTLFMHMYTYTHIPILHLQISYGSSSPTLSDRDMFPKFFRTIPSETQSNSARFALMEQYNWTKVATLHETRNVFTLVS